MTVALALCGLAAAFVIGFLLGDRRGVKQCNAILDENMRVVMKAIQEPRFELDGNENETAAHTVH
ncbi:MAG TPA: hypothetical protein VGX71_13520 [Pseudaminobacter sp.]|nr:hypothetical protein [Pseudaminobacter sp.]